MEGMRERGKGMKARENKRQKKTEKGVKMEEERRMMI